MKTEIIKGITFYSHELMNADWSVNKNVNHAIVADINEELYFISHLIYSNRYNVFKLVEVV